MINLKITNAQLQSYQEEGKIADLQYLENRLCEDNEIEYVYNESQKQANTEKQKIKIEGEIIFTKLIDYPYEFEINSNLQLASIKQIEKSIKNYGFFFHI